MANPNYALVFNLFEDRGDGKLYLSPSIGNTYTDQVTAQNAARALMSSVLSKDIAAVVVIKNEYTELERVDHAEGEAWAEREKIAADAENVLALRPKV